MVIETASVAALSIASSILTHGAFVPKSQVFGPVVSTLAHPLSTRRIALTFDDGPSPQATLQILDILQEFNMASTFFVIGRHATENPDMLREIIDRGHAIGNHTFDHHRHGLFRHYQYWLNQIQRTDHAVYKATGSKPTCFRPPMGFKSPAIFKAAKSCNYKIVNWSRRACDGRVTTSEAIENRLVNKAQPNDIVLMHDGYEPARNRDLSPIIQALPQILDSIVKADLKPVLFDSNRVLFQGKSIAQ